MRVRGALVAGVVALLAGLTIRSVHADDLVPVQLEYDGPAGCPDAEAFTREVLARAPRARLAPPAEHARVLAAQVKPAGAHGYDGVLVVRDPNTVATERSLHAPSCAELVTALAVIAAVVIDPITAKTGSIDAGDATATTSADGGASGPPSAADAGAPSPSPAREGPVPEAPAPGGRVRTSTDRWEVSAGAGGGAIGGSAPTLLFSVPVFFEVARDAAGILEPALRLRFERTATAASEDGGFSRTGGAVDLCPIAFRRRSLRVQPCARAELAALFAKGREVEPVRSDVRPWFAVGPVGRARLELAAPVFLELEGALMVAMVRDRFFVEPGTLVYRAPLLGATTAFAVGVAF